MKSDGWVPARDVRNYAAGQVCAWWVDEDERHGHCAALDWVRRRDDDPD